MAGSITNLDDKPQTITVDCHCNTPDVVIPAGQTWRVTGKAKIIYQGREISLGENDEYAIWKNNGIGPQRRARHGARANN